jgi:hypothetical protein
MLRLNKIHTLSAFDVDEQIADISEDWKKMRECF